MSVRYAGAPQEGLTPEKITALNDLDSEAFTPRERAALRFAELLAVDHHKIDDALFAELQRHFTAAQIIEIGVSAGLNLGLGRLNAVLGIEPA